MGWPPGIYRVRNAWNNCGNVRREVVKDWLAVRFVKLRERLVFGRWVSLVCFAVFGGVFGGGFGFEVAVVGGCC